MFSSEDNTDLHYAKAVARASWKEHTSMTVDSWTGIRSSASSSCRTWSLGVSVVLSTSMVLKMYSVDTGTGDGTGDETGVV